MVEKQLSLVTFLLLLLTFPYWFPVVMLGLAVIVPLWVIGYSTACTAHWLWMRLVHKKSVPWQLLYPTQ